MSPPSRERRTWTLVSFVILSTRTFLAANAEPISDLRYSVAD
jgi:hypothetical protein